MKTESEYTRVGNITISDLRRAARRQIDRSFYISLIRAVSDFKQRTALFNGMLKNKTYFIPSDIQAYLDDTETGE